MGYNQVRLCHSELSNLFFFLCFFHITCLHAQLCSQEQSFALFQFKQQFSLDKSVSHFCDYRGTLSFPKMESWKESFDCCSWDGVECDKETSQVIGLDLSCSWIQGTIQPNSTLFDYFPHLQRLNLAFNNFGKSPISSAFSRFTRLTHLNLSYSSFSGEVPIEISFLSKLVSLDLSNNYHLRIEKSGYELLVQNLTKIRELNLGHVDISSVVLNSLLNLTSLTHLDLSWCGLHGKFPNEIFQLPHLNELRVRFNPALTGYFPKFINLSSPLQYLDLSVTIFSGEVPNSIGNLKSLKELVAYHCKFYGSIPTSLGNLTKLTNLVLSFNNFTGMVPSSLSNLGNLFYLGFSGNNFEGTIADFLPNSENLAFVYLGLNNFNGMFPPLIANLTKLVSLDISNNHLTGPLPSQITGLPNLIRLQLSHNLINGTIPSWVFTLPTLWYIFLNYNKLTGHVHEFQSTSLRFVDLSNNNLYGIIPSSTFELMSLNHLILSSNNFFGTIPESNNFSKNLYVLDLQKNNFSGIIPNIFARGNKLQTINLNGNGFEWSIPKSLVNCIQLEVLDLGSNKFYDKFPQWLENLPNLHVLILRSNKFHGPMPTSNTKFPFPNLRVVDMSNNYFSGPLPEKYFQHFKAMMNHDEANFELQYMQKHVYSGNYYHDSLTMVIKGSTVEMVKVLTIFTAIDLSRNNFEGEIPNIIGRLNSTRGLNFSHNSLTGHIPASLANLTMLEWLDLSSNKLNGEIPQQLRNLISLEVLNLSQNQLTGPIPQGNQFGTFLNDSYIGNLALCGPPLSNACNPRTPQPPPVMFQQEDNTHSLSGFNWEVILPGYGCGLVWGLVMGYLMFSTGKPQWLVQIIEGE